MEFSRGNGFWNTRTKSGITSRRGNADSYGTMEIPTVPPLAPPPEEYVPEIRVHSNSGGGDVAAKTEMVIYDPSCADPAKTIETDIPPNKSILLTGCARQLNLSEMRSRCVLKDFATTVRDDVFAPTLSPSSVCGLLLYAAWFDLQVVTGDLVCPFMQPESSCKMFP